MPVSLTIRRNSEQGVIKRPRRTRQANGVRRRCERTAVISKAPDQGNLAALNTRQQLGSTPGTLTRNGMSLRGLVVVLDVERLGLGAFTTRARPGRVGVLPAVAHGPDR